MVTANSCIRILNAVPYLFARHFFFNAFNTRLLTRLKAGTEITTTLFCVKMCVYLSRHRTGIIPPAAKEESFRSWVFVHTPVCAKREREREPVLLCTLAKSSEEIPELCVATVQDT